MNSNELIKNAFSDTAKLISDNEQTLKSIKDKVEKTEQLIFDKNCFKRDHLEKCEVSLCSFFNDSTCKYPEAHGQLKLILKDLLPNI